MKSANGETSYRLKVCFLVCWRNGRNIMEIDSKEINMRDVECPCCGEKLDYRQLIKSEMVILKRYKAILKHLKEEYGEVFIDKHTVLLGKIKELEYLYSILIK